MVLIVKLKQNGDVVVVGVGFDVRETFGCVFKVEELGDDTSFRGGDVEPASITRVNCGQIPDV
jgi:hypothetical protein